MAVRCVRKGEECPRKRLLEVLSGQVLKFTGQFWLAAGLQLVQTERSVLVFFLGSNGSLTDPDIVISSLDPLYHNLQMKMKFAVRRSELASAS